MAALRNTCGLPSGRECLRAASGIWFPPIRRLLSQGTGSGVRSSGWGKPSRMMAPIVFRLDRCRGCEPLFSFTHRDHKEVFARGTAKVGVHRHVPGAFLGNRPGFDRPDVRDDSRPSGKITATAFMIEGDTLDFENREALQI